MKNRQRHRSGSPGFSLVEMLVVVMIFGMVSIGLFQVLTSTRSSYEQQKVTLEMQQNARAGLEGLSDDFRHVSYGKDPTQPSIDYACADSVVFVADIIPSVSGAEVITYALSDVGDEDTPNPNDTVLMKTVTDTLGNVLIREPQAYGIKAGGLNMRYFNGAGVELPRDPVPQPELIGEVLLEVTAVEPRAHPRSGQYLEQTLTTTIYPRNLPLTPARSRPSMPTIGTLSMPNCESVTIPWTTPTTNTDGTDLDLADISHFTVYFGLHPDSLSLYSRVARTINQWTIAGLTGNQMYYLSVTCTSRSGVESNKPQASINLSDSRIPKSPENVATAPEAGGGIRVSWDIVTHFTNDDLITTPIDYNLYRSTSSGFTPGPSSLLNTMEAQNWFVDTTLVDCTTYYYLVTAQACGSESTPSSELSAGSPAPPDIVYDVAASLTAQSGEVEVTWSPPHYRVDGTPLPSDEISGARIFYNTTPGCYDTYYDYWGSDSTHTLLGLLAISLRPTSSRSTPLSPAIPTSRPRSPLWPPSVSTSASTSLGRRTTSTATCSGTASTTTSTPAPPTPAPVPTRGLRRSPSSRARS